MSIDVRRINMTGGNTFCLDCYNWLSMSDFPLPHLDMLGLEQGSGTGNDGFKSMEHGAGSKDLREKKHYALCSMLPALSL